MKKYLIGLAILLTANTAFADEIILKFLNCTGKDLAANWTGYKVNIDRSAPNDVQQGQFELPGNKRVITKTLKLYRTSPTSTDEHLFSFYFIQGLSGHVTFNATPYQYNQTLYGSKFTMTSSSANIYLPKSSLEVPNGSTSLIADILIGCE